MGLNISKGNMYDFVSHTYNTIKGECAHDCVYCFMKQYGELNPVRLDQKEFKTNLGTGNFIFVGSSCDMWAEDIPKGWILQTLEYCRTFNNRYLFQSKNPVRMLEFQDFFPPDVILGTTIETNRVYPEMGKTITPEARASAMARLRIDKFKTMLTIEPVMDFDIWELLKLIKLCGPEWVTVGVDTKNHALPEPDSIKIVTLLDSLKAHDIEYKIKDNLNRLL